MSKQQEPAKLPKPTSYEDLYPGRFIHAADFKGARVTLRISEVNIEELEGDKGKQVKGILLFHKTDKQMALNRTNGECLKGMFGRKPQDWVGKRVTFFPAPYDGNLPLDITECIRIYGSPDIQSDMKVTIRLPRKRAFTMTMCRVTREAAATHGVATPAATPSPTGESTYDAQSALQALREAGDRPGIDALYAKICEDLGNKIPIEVEALYKDLREAMES